MQGGLPVSAYGQFPQQRRVTAATTEIRAEEERGHWTLALMDGRGHGATASTVVLEKVPSEGS